MNNLQNLNTLFNNCLFRIPDYQRGYSWGTQQLEEFWNDLLSMLPGQDHYTGMISLKNVDQRAVEASLDKWNNEKWLVDNGYQIYEVVDGQQRLTTITILLNEIYNYCQNHGLKELNDISIGEISDKFLVRSKSDNIIKTYKFGYEVDNPSYTYFKVVILGDNDKTEIKETFYTLNLANAKRFFSNKLEPLSVEDVTNIYRKVTLHLKFNLYNINDDFNVFVAFETMNNRGKRLSYLELLKNRLIYLSTLFRDDEDTKKTVRNNINDTWKEIYGYLGKNKSHPLSDDEFLRDHWTIYFGYNTRKTTGNKTIQFHDYILSKYFIQQNIEANNLSIYQQSQQPDMTNDAFDNDLLASSDDEEDEEEEEEEDNTESITPTTNKSLKLASINDYIKSLRELIPFWYQTYEPKEVDNPEISKYLFRLNALGFANARPLVTVLLSKKNISDADKLNCIKIIERYNFLHYKLGSYTATWKNSTFYNYARDLYFDNITIDNIIEQISKIDYLSSNNVIMTQSPIEKFEKLFKKEGFYSWGALRYLLYIYDTSKAETPAEQLDPISYFSKDPKDHYSIEHIYPQKPTDAYWLNNFDGLSKADSKALTGSLGNLLPLSTRINSQLQNYSFDRKKSERYRHGSRSEMEVAEYAKWTPDTILERGLILLNFAEQEFNFRFPHDLYRKKLLGLGFMANTEEDSKSHRTEPIVLEERPSNEKDKKVYHEEDHLTGRSSQIRAMYNQIREKLLALGDIFIEPKKFYIAFKRNTNVCDIQTQASQIKITINIKSGNLVDPKEMAKDMYASQKQHWGNGAYEVLLKDPNDIDYVMSLIEQSYKIH